MPGARRYLVELVATFFLTLTVLAAAAQDLTLGALAIGAMVAVLLQAGGYANPVLTLACVVTRRMRAGELLPCWAAQFVGALLGAALSRWLVDAPAVSPLQDVGVLRLAAVEVLFTFAFCYVVLREERGWAAAAGGLTVVAAAAAVDPVAASAFNPATAFAQVVAGVTEWGTVWAYLVACPVGGALAGVVSTTRRRVPSARPLD